MLLGGESQRLAGVEFQIVGVATEKDRRTVLGQ